MLLQTVLLDVLEHEGATHHVGGYQDDDTNLGEHEGQNDLQKEIKRVVLKREMKSSSTLNDDLHKNMTFISHYQPSFNM